VSDVTRGQSAQDPASKISERSPIADAKRPLKLVVLGDSLSSFAPDQSFRPGDEHLFPARLRRELEAGTSRTWSVDLLAQTWWSISAASQELRDSPELQARLYGADAVVVALATADMLPVVPFTRRLLRGPTTVQSHRPILRGVKPRWLRPLIWSVFAGFHLAFVRLSRGRYRHTPTKALARAWPALIRGIQDRSPDAVICAVLPTVGREGAFIWPTRHRAEVASEIGALARAHGVPVVDLAAVVQPWVHELPDGTHWHYVVHNAVARALAAVLLAQASFGSSRSSLGAERATTNPIEHE
jgi:hypothetical protein